MNRTDRLLGIVLEFQARGEARAEDLARRFEVSVRTVYRDVQALSETGVPIVAMPGKGYRLMDGYFLPPLCFTADEAALLALGGAFVRDRVDAELRGTADDALRKLDGVLPADRREAVARWRRELLFTHIGYRIDESKLSGLRTAVRDRHVVRLRYHALRRPEAEEREVEPVSLVYLNEAWHLAAYCRLRQGPRVFRLDRIDRCDRNGERFVLSDRHRTGFGGDIVRDAFPEARVWFDPAVERWVRERQPFLFRREEHDGDRPVFVYSLRDADELLPWLLCWGGSVTVISPDHLRARLAAEARAILERHSTIPDVVPDRTVSGMVP